MSEAAPTAGQRLVIETTSGTERFAMGAAALDTTHGGISIQAKRASAPDSALPGYIWLQTQGTVPAASGQSLSCTMTFQSSGLVNVQSWESSTYLFSTGSTAIFGGEKTFVATPGNIMLFAGPPHFNVDGSARDSLVSAEVSDPSDRPTDSMATMSYPATTVQTAVKTAKTIWFSINTAVVASCLSFFAFTIIKKSNKTWASVGGTMRKMMPAVLGSTTSFLNTALGAVVKATPDEKGVLSGLKHGGFSLFSYAGLLMGTPGFVAVYGGVAYAYRSLNVTQLGYVLASVKCLGGPITLFSMASVGSACALGGTTVEADEEIILNGETENLTLEGEDVELGGEYEYSRAITLKTNSISLTSTDAIEVDATGAVDIETTDTANFQATKEASFEAQQSLTLNVGDAYKVELTAAGGILCSKTAGGGPTLKITSEGIELLGPGGQCRLKLSPTGVEFGSASESLIIGPAATTAPQIEIC